MNVTNFSTSTIILIIINLLLTFVGFYICKNKSKKIEGFEDKEELESSILDLSKVIDDDGKLIVDNLEVTDKLTVNNDLNISGTQEVKGKITSPNGKMGSWEIRGQKIGVPGRADMDLAPDKWIRNYIYGTTSYSPDVGFAGNKLFSTGNSICQNINLGNTFIDRSGRYIRLFSSVEVNNALSGQKSEPGLIANNIIFAPSKKFDSGSWWTGVKGNNDGHNTAVSVARKMPKGFIVMGPALSPTSVGDSSNEFRLSAAKRIAKSGCNVRGMHYALGNHGGSLACQK